MRLTQKQMATIKRIDGKNGVAFQITVTQGRDVNGKQVRHYRTWKPEGKMTERQMQKAVARAAADFEREIEQGYQIDNRQTFSEYARYVLESKRAEGIKEKTIHHYERERCPQRNGKGYGKGGFDSHFKRAAFDPGSIGRKGGDLTDNDHNCLQRTGNPGR